MFGKKTLYQQTSFRVVLIYLIVAVIWITVSDLVVEVIFDDPGLITRAQTIKGWLFVFANAGLIYWLIRRFNHKFEKSIEMQKEISREREIHSMIVENIPVMITIYNPNLSDFRINKEYERVTGWNAEDMIDPAGARNVFPDDEKWEKIREFMKNPDGNWMDMEMTTKSGKKVPSTWTNVRLTDDTQIGIGVDISERTQHFEELQDKEYLLREAQRVSSLGTYRLNLNTGRAETSAVLNSIFGLEKGFHLEDWAAAIHPKDKNRITSHLEEVMQNRERFDEEYRIIRASDEKERWVHGVGEIRVEEGGLMKMIGTIRDITDEKKAQEQLEQQRYFLRESQRIANLGTYRLDLKTGEAEGTDILKAIFGFEPEHELHIDDWFSTLHPDHREMMKDYQQEVIREKGFFDKEYKIIRASDGEERWLYEVAELRFDENGELAEMIGSVHDITEKKMSEMALYESRELLRKTFDSLWDAFFILDPETRVIVDCNRGAEQMFGYELSEMIGKTTEFLHVDRDHYQRFGKLGRNQFVETGAFSTEFIMKKSNGELFYTGHSISYLYDEEGKPSRIVSVVRDISDEKKEREQMISSILQGSENERKRIAKELHDGLGQHLSAASMNLESIAEDLDILSEKRKNSYQKGFKQLNEAITEVRRISQNLMPKAIEDFGLKLAVESLAEDLENSFNIPITVESNLGENKLSDQVELNLYRIIQEALLNALRHSNCSKIDVQVYKEGDNMNCTIEDDGVGFDPSIKKSAGLGLNTIKSRAQTLSGQLEISSRPDKGTVVSVVIPLSDLPA